MGHRFLTRRESQSLNYVYHLWESHVEVLMVHACQTCSFQSWDSHVLGLEDAMPYIVQGPTPTFSIKVKAVLMMWDLFSYFIGKSRLSSFISVYRFDSKKMLLNACKNWMPLKSMILFLPASKELAFSQLQGLVVALWTFWVCKGQELV